MREHWDVLDNIIEYSKMKNGRHWRHNWHGALYGIDDSQKDDVMEKLPLGYTKVLKKAYK